MWADPDRLDQILANLIENALRHGRGTITLAGDATATSPSRPRTLLSAMRGKGSRRAHRVLVFTRFWQGGHRGGTGLGLYVVRGLVEAHGGVVRVEDAEGAGACFRATFPDVPDVP